MSIRPDTITAEFELQLIVPGSASLPVMASVRYEPSDPYAIYIGFHTGGTETVEWTFARQLLTDGVNRLSGDGDVQVWPTHSSGRPVVCLALSSPSGRALFEMPLSELVEFLSRTYAVVPTGNESEFLDVDAELALLLWSDPS